MAKCVFAFLTITLLISNTFSENIELKLNDENSKSEDVSSTKLNEDNEITSNQYLDNVNKEVDKKLNKNPENKNTHEPNGKLDEKNEENSQKSEPQKEEFQVFFGDEDGEDENFKHDEDGNDDSLGINENVNYIDEGKNDIDEEKNSEIKSVDNSLKIQNENSKDIKTDATYNDQNNNNNNEKKRQQTTWEKAELALKKRQKAKSKTPQKDTTLTTDTVSTTFINHFTDQNNNNNNNENNNNDNINNNNDNINDKDDNKIDNVNDNKNDIKELDDDISNRDGNTPNIDINKLAAMLNNIEDVENVDNVQDEFKNEVFVNEENIIELNLKEDTGMEENVIKSDRIDGNSLGKDTHEEKEKENVKKEETKPLSNADTSDDKTISNPTATTTRTSFINRGPSSVINTRTTTTTTAPTTTTTTPTAPTTTAATTTPTATTTTAATTTTTTTTTTAPTTTAATTTTTTTTAPTTTTAATTTTTRASLSSLLNNDAASADFKFNDKLAKEPLSKGDGELKAMTEKDNENVDVKLKEGSEETTSNDNGQLDIDDGVEFLESIDSIDLSLIKQAHDSVAMSHDKDTGVNSNIVDHTTLSTDIPITTAANSINTDDGDIQSDTTTIPVITTTEIVINHVSIELTVKSDENVDVDKDREDKKKEKLDNVSEDKSVADEGYKDGSDNTRKILKLNEIIKTPTDVEERVPVIGQDDKEASKVEDRSTDKKDGSGDHEDEDEGTVEDVVETSDNIHNAKSTSQEYIVKPDGEKDTSSDSHSSLYGAIHKATDDEDVATSTKSDSSDINDTGSPVKDAHIPSYQEGEAEKINMNDAVVKQNVEYPTNNIASANTGTEENEALEEHDESESDDSINNDQSVSTNVPIADTNVSDTNADAADIDNTDHMDESSDDVNDEGDGVNDEEDDVTNPKKGKEADINKDNKDDDNNNDTDNNSDKNGNLNDNSVVNKLDSVSDKGADDASYRQYEQEAFVNDIGDYNDNGGTDNIANKDDNKEEIAIQKDSDTINGVLSDVDGRKAHASKSKAETPQDEHHFGSEENTYHNLLRAKQEELTREINSVPSNKQQLGNNQKLSNEELGDQREKNVERQSIHPQRDSNINIFNGNFYNLNEVSTGTENANENIDEIDDVVETTTKPSYNTASSADTTTAAPHVPITKAYDTPTTTVIIARAFDSFTTAASKAETTTSSVKATMSSEIDGEALIENKDKLDQDFLRSKDSKDDETNEEDEEEAEDEDEEELEDGEERNEEDGASNETDEDKKESEDGVTSNEEAADDEVPTKETVEEKTTADDKEEEDEDMEIRGLAENFFSEENDLAEKNMQMMGVDVTLKPHSNIHDISPHQTNPETPVAEYEQRQDSEPAPNKTARMNGDDETWLTSTFLPYKVMFGLTLQKLDQPITYAISIMPPSMQVLFTHSPFQLYPTHAFILFFFSSSILFSILFFQGFQVWRNKKKIDDKIKIQEMVSTNQHALCVMEQEKDDLNKELKSTLDKLTAFEESNKARKLETEKINKELKEVLIEKNSLKEQVTKLEQTLDKTEKQLKAQTPNTNNKELEDKLEEANNSVKLYERQNNELKASLQKSKQSAMQMQGQLEVVNDEISTLQKSKDQLINQAESWTDKVSELMEMVRVSGELEKKHRRVLAKRDAQIEELQQSFKKLDAFKLISVSEEEEEEEEEEGEEKEGGDDNDDVKLQRFMGKIEKMIDIVKLNEELQKREEDVSAMKMNLSKEVDERLKLEEKLAEMKREMEGVEEEKRSAESQVSECKVKMQVLSEYFRDKENNLNRLLSEKEEKERMTSKNFDQLDERVRQSEKMVALYKEQSEELKKEIKKIEADYKKQIAMQEKKSQENWLLARQSEREAKKLHMEAQMQRQRLLELQEKQDSLKEDSTKGSNAGSRPGSRPNIIPYPGFRPGMDRQFRGPSPLLPPFIPPPGRFIPPYSRIREDYMDHPSTDLSPIPYPRNRSPDLSDRSGPRSDSPHRSSSRHSRSPPYRSRSPPNRRSSPRRQGSPYRSPIYRSRSPSFQSDSSGYRKNLSNRFSGHLNSEEEILAVENHQYSDNDKKRRSKKV